MTESPEAAPNKEIVASALPEELDEEQKQEMALRLELAELTLALIKGMLQSSYYAPDHPAAKGVALAAYERLKVLQKRFSEITYLVQGGREDDELVLEGVFPEAITLTNLIRSTMGEHFARKLRTYFQRNKLISVSIKTIIGEEEFDRFVAVFVERNLMEGGEAAATAARFTEQLYAKEIVNVNVMLEDDLVGARRKLPWRVRMAISRLRKDLRVIPLYAKATKTELREAKELIITDIIRPLRRPDFLKELLVNSDLIVEDVPELRGSDIESEIIATFSHGILGTVAWSLVSDLERVTWEKAKGKKERVREQVVGAIKRSLRKVSIRLAREESDQAIEVIRHLFEKRLLAFEELPPRLQQRIRVETWTEAFLADEEVAFARLEQAGEKRPYLEQLSTFTGIYCELLRRQRFAATHRIVSVILAHAVTPVPWMAERDKFIQRALRQIRNEETFTVLVKALEEADLETREHLRETLVMLGADAVPHLLRSLRETRSSAVRKEVCAAMVGIGPEAGPQVVEELRRYGRKGQHGRLLLLLLGDLQCEEAASDLIRFASHPDPKLREEALVSLFKLRGKRAEAQFVVALDDKDPHIQRRALVLLASFGSRHREIATFVARTLRPRDPKDDEPEPPVILQDIAIDTAAHLGNVALEGGGTLEEVLLAVLQHGQRSSFRRLLGGGQRPKPDILRVSACDALGKIGSRLAEPALYAALRDKSEELREHAVAALDQIHARAAEAARKG